MPTSLKTPAMNHSSPTLTVCPYCAASAIKRIGGCTVHFGKQPACHVPNLPSELLVRCQECLHTWSAPTEQAILLGPEDEA